MSEGKDDRSPDARRQAKYRERHKEKIRKAREEAFKANPEKIRKYNRSYKQREYAANPEAFKARVLKYKRQNPEKVRRSQSISSRKRTLRTKYGLTTEQYEAMVFSRGGLCDICQRKPQRKLGIDHDHKTGIVRGLLCHNCNVALGLMRDDPGALLAAIRYLSPGVDKAPQEADEIQK